MKKIIVNIPEIKVKNEFIVLNSHENKRINISELSIEEKDTYEKFIKITDNSDFFELRNTNYDLHIHRLCNVKVNKDKYIEFENISIDENKIVEEFVKVIKNKVS